MEDRDNPGSMLGEPSGMDEVWMSLYNEDPEYRATVDRQQKADVFIYDNSVEGVTLSALSYGLGCSDDEANKALDDLVYLGKVLADATGVYRHVGWLKENK